VKAAFGEQKSWLIVWCDLVKARLTGLALATTLAGFYAGARGPIDFGLMLHTVLGTALVAAGASALNQLLEREYDAKMRRTEDRPLPSGRLRPETVLAFGGLASILGLIHLGATVNGLTALLAAVTLVTYLAVYTPLKRVTPLNTLIGAIAGGLPPLMGWTAARGELGGAGWCLFGIQFCWQIPHFLAIAWLYRDDYARAGFAMLAVVDPTGRRTGCQTVGYTLALLGLSLAPFFGQLAGRAYLCGALVLGLGLLGCAAQFAGRPNCFQAKRLFIASILYLPLLLGLLVLDKLK
jgi:protoheme IX farnesyltransferase